MIGGEERKHGLADWTRRKHAARGGMEASEFVEAAETADGLRAGRLVSGEPGTHLGTGGANLA